MASILPLARPFLSVEHNEMCTIYCSSLDTISAVYKSTPFEAHIHLCVDVRAVGRFFDFLSNFGFISSMFLALNAVLLGFHSIVISYGCACHSRPFWQWEKGVRRDSFSFLTLVLINFVSPNSTNKNSTKIYHNVIKCRTI